MTLIDHTNYDTLLQQSTTARGATPNGNVYFDKTNNEIQLIGVDELATVAITARTDEDKVFFDVRMPIIDWRDNRTRRRLLCSYLVPVDISSAQQFFRWLDETVLPVFDRHEHNEWFRIDGVAIFNPHVEHPPGLRSLNEQVLNQTLSVASANI